MDRNKNRIINSKKTSAKNNANGISLLESLITLALLSIGLISYQIASHTLLQARATHQQQLNTLYQQQTKEALQVILAEQLDPAIIDDRFTEHGLSNHQPQVVCAINQWCTAQQLLEYEASTYSND